MARNHRSRPASREFEMYEIEHTMTAREMALTEHELDGTCNRATLKTGEVYRWDNRRGLWAC